METATYRYLQELSKSEFQIVGGEPNILNWKVNNEHGTYIGEVKELLFDPETRAVRYLLIDLTGNGMHLDGKRVMIPIGLAHIHIEKDEVVLPNIHIDQFNALPDYRSDDVTPETEVMIRSVIGSPAALRIEETITNFDQNEFYAHHHFNDQQFFQRERSSSLPGAINDLADRSEERAVVHQLIEHHEAHQADQHNGEVNEKDEETLDNPLTRGI